MSGLRKAKKYDWKDSNLALFGSDVEKNVKKAAAETEEAWHGCGQKVGLEIWRIEQFKVKSWPKQDYGRFYSGDSYIILNTYKPNPDSNELEYDLHFWIGQESTQDEYGTAAYKTVELDTYLNDKPVQFREVQNHESDRFKSYFKRIQLLSGGCKTGFNHVEPKEYVPRLLHFSGTRKNIKVKEVECKRDMLNPTDVFVLDKGLSIFVWQGPTANMDERFKAMQFAQDLKSERAKGVDVEVIDDTDTDSPFYTTLSDEPSELDEDDADGDFEPTLFRLSDESGELKFTRVKEGRVTQDDFERKDVFIFDTGKYCFVWIGRGASVNEKKRGMEFAHNYLNKTEHPLIPVSCIKDGQKPPKSFTEALS